KRWPSGARTRRARGVCPECGRGRAVDRDGVGCNLSRMEIVCVTIDCTDPAPVARFWNEALHWGGVSVSENGDGALCGPAAGGMYLEFIRVPETKTTKNRVHLGLTA